MLAVICGCFCYFFFFNDTATTEIYTLSDTLSLHDALPISSSWPGRAARSPRRRPPTPRSEEHTSELQSPLNISYAVFCLKKKKNKTYTGCTTMLQGSLELTKNQSRQ